jgi:hypothetical protein
MVADNNQTDKPISPLTLFNKLYLYVQTLINSFADRWRKKILNIVNVYTIQPMHWQGS